MQSKTFALIALSASAALASPFHKRASVHHHHKIHGTGSHSLRPSGTAGLFPVANDTNGHFPPTGGVTFVSETQTETQVITMTVSPLPAGSGSAPANFGNAAATGVEASSSSSSCVSTSIATETSINLVTVTASPQAVANTKAVEAGGVSAGAFYGQSKSWGGGWGSSYSAPAASQSTPAASTTFATMPSASKSFGTSSSASASASASATASGSSGSSGGKRGISFNDASLVSAFGNAVSWAYNWGSVESGKLGVEFVPMMWGSKDVSGFASKVGSATHVLSLNEPDLSSQSNLDPKTAASLHKQGMQSLVGKVQIGSPAITNGQGSSPPMGTTWLDQFFQACGGDCPVDFVAYHWYGGADAIEDFKSHTQAVISTAAKYNVKKVWCTEFAPSGSTDAQASFMKEAVSFLDSTSAVERYAAFMASSGTLLSGTSLNSVGSAYVAAS